MKAILMSIRPQHTCNILNDIKLWEIRKKFPKYYVGWVYIYVTKTLPHLAHSIDGDYEVYDETQWDKDWIAMNGKVVARFWCDKVEKFDRIMIDFEREDLKQNACISQLELDNYIKDNIGYAIHINDLEIFDKPKEISEFYAPFKQQYMKGVYAQHPLTRAPESFCYIEID